jgi:hypothetical protein
MVSLIGECPSPPSQLNETGLLPASTQVDTEGDVGEDDDPMATCINCGADTFDLTNIGEVRSAGRDMPT